jgi:predicted dehydrogenase
LRTIEAVLVGAGHRGRDVYGAWALAHPERLRITALAEPRESRRLEFARRHGLSPERLFADWRELLARPQAADAAIIASGDHEHAEPAQRALEAGYQVLLEKPMAPTLAECVAVVETAEREKAVLQVAHVLRYTSFYARIADIVRSGRLGRLLTIDMREHIAHWHMTHSFVRGKFRSEAVAAPILLAKSCHDLDLLCWLVGTPPERVFSSGSLAHFRLEDAPPGAPARCTDGCPVQESCVHDAVRFYVGPDDALARGWPWVDVSDDPSREARRRALEAGPYGRCVYHCDNDVLDHQALLVDFQGGVLASFALHGHATHETRTLRISGSEGELRARLHGGRIEVTRHGSLDVERIEVPAGELGHFGGDQGLLDHFTDVVARGALDEARTSGRISLASHVLGFTAEQSRREGRPLPVPGY